MGCGGLGIYNCYCGGDLCVCSNYGEYECFGCPDCEPADDDDYYPPEEELKQNIDKANPIRKNEKDFRAGAGASVVETK